jgi:hypothetical protein
MDLGLVVKSKTHSHAQSAGHRKTAVNAFKELASSMGYDVFSYSMSNQDLRRGLVGDRPMYWWRDLCVSGLKNFWTQIWGPAKNQITQYIDVDYYVDDLEDRLAKTSNPVCLFTKIPLRANNSDGEVAWTFNQDQDFVCEISGTDKFQHKLWDYNSDHIVVHGWHRILGIPVWPITRLFMVERRHITGSLVDATVLLVPSVSVNGLSSIICRQSLRGYRLKRFQPVQNGFIAFKVQDPSGLFITVGKTDQYNSAYLSMTDRKSVV